MRKRIWEGHYRTASVYNNLGNIYYKTDKYDLALDFYKKALSISELIKDKQYTDIASPYNNIGLIYTEKSYYDLALEYLNKALSLFIEDFLHLHPQ